MLRAVPKMAHLSVDQETDVILKAFGAQRLVIAHTPDLKGIEFLSGGRVARMDTGISRAYGGPLTWLEISDGKMVPRRIERSSQMKQLLGFVAALACAFSFPPAPPTKNRYSMPASPFISSSGFDFSIHPRPIFSRDHFRSAD